MLPDPRRQLFAHVGRLFLRSRSKQRREASSPGFLIVRGGKCILEEAHSYESGNCHCVVPARLHLPLPFREQLRDRYFLGKPTAQTFLYATPQSTPKGTGFGRGTAEPLQLIKFTPFSEDSGLYHFLEWPPSSRDARQRIVVREGRIFQGYRESDKLWRRLARRLSKQPERLAELTEARGVTTNWSPRIFFKP